MTDSNSSQQWQRLAQKMVWSYSGDESEEMKNQIIARYRAGVRRRNASLAAGVVILCSALIWPLSTYLKHDEAVSVKADSSHNASDAGAVADARFGTQTKAPDAHGDGVSGLASDTSPRATPLTPGTRFSVEEETGVSTYRIAVGSVRFEKGPSVTRRLVVHVGALTIEDIGTVFTVETLLDAQVHIAVAEGRVRVTWPTGDAELTEGTDGTFPSGYENIAPVSALHRDGSVKIVPDAMDWRTLARNGQNRQALRSIDSDPSRVRNQVADLLLAADVMRLTGNPQRAVPYLNRVVREFPGDTRRPAAAFTLGKVLLNELGRPAAAASMFAIAAQKSSPLAEEAIAREAEAWYRAGNFTKSRMAARKYLEYYPNGARAESVRALNNGTP
ncbi:MAG: tetratricopeptide repeat protein [Deltaproteobacteria bacterium]|nr:tetratricopeptide repeat protein [Deltaproteobacteria bacterium]